MQPADVSCFKSLKVLWKKTLKEFKTTTINLPVTKINFGNLMWKAISQWKSETIKNGFKASGIYPWNKEAIDYSKCLGKVFPKTINSQPPKNVVQNDVKLLDNTT